MPSNPIPETQYPHPGLAHRQKLDSAQRDGGGWPTNSTPRPLKTTGRNPPSIYDCGTPFCHASPLWWPSTYNARPTHTILIDRREPLPHPQRRMANISKGDGPMGGRPVAGAAISARTQGAGRPREGGERPVLTVGRNHVMTIIGTQPAVD